MEEQSSTKVVTIEQYHAAFHEQHVSSIEHIACKCVMCGTVQSPADFMRVMGKPMSDIEKYFGYSCIGRFTGAGPHKSGKKPGSGCDWTLGGLLRLHNYVVVDEAGVHHPRFAPVTADEAQAHEASQPAASAA